MFVATEVKNKKHSKIAVDQADTMPALQLAFLTKVHKRTDMDKFVPPRKPHACLSTSALEPEVNFRAVGASVILAEIPGKLFTLPTSGSPVSVLAWLALTSRAEEKGTGRRSKRGRAARPLFLLIYGLCKRVKTAVAGQATSLHNLISHGIRVYVIRTQAITNKHVANNRVVGGPW